MIAPLEVLAAVVQAPWDDVEAVGFQPDWWDTVGLRSAWDWIEAFVKKYHQPPSWEVLSREFSLPLTPPPATDPLPMYRDGLWRAWMVERFQKELPPDWDLDDHFEEAGERLSLLADLWQHDPSLAVATTPTEGADWVWDKVEQKESLLLPTGIPEWDQFIGGWLPTDYVVIAGRPHTGKSWLLLEFARRFWSANRRPILFCNLENSAEEMQARFHATVGALPYGPLLTGVGKLSEVQQAAFAKQAASYIGEKLPALADVPFWTINSSDLDEPLTPRKLGTYIQRLKPAAVFIDQLSWLDPDQRVQSIRERYVTVSRALFHLSRRFQIPIFLAAQINRSGDDNAPPAPTAIQESDNLLQDSTTLMTIAKLPNRDVSGIAMQVWKSHVIQAMDEDVQLQYFMELNGSAPKVWWEFGMAPGEGTE